MSTRPCAWPNDRLIAKHFLARIFPKARSFQPIFSLLVIIAGLMISTPCHAQDPIIVAVTLNQQKQNDLFVYPGKNGDFLVRVTDLQAMGFQKLSGERVPIDGDIYTSLKSMQGVQYTFDEKTLTLAISADPRLLPGKVIDLGPTRKPGVIYPQDNSFFLNYGLDYATGGEDSFSFEAFNLSNEMGLRFKDTLFLTDSLYSKTPDNSHFVRLNSRLIYDWRDSLRRFTAGDFSASSGSLGSNVQMGGLSLSKVYGINPYFIQYPLFDFTGLLPLPAQIDLYLDGAKVHSERLSPGEFELANFQSFGGAQTVEVVIRDSLGREQRIVSPFYFTDRILRRGLQEYSYNLGMLRRGFGRQSNSYHDLAFSGFHRFGITDTFNLGLRTEADNDLLNFGVESAFKTGSFGVMQLQAAFSGSRYHGGGGGLLSYDFQSRNFRASLAIQGFSAGYRTLGNSKDDSSYRPRLNIRAGVGYITRSFGSFGLDYYRIGSYNQTARETLTLSWARRLLPRTYLSTNLRQIRQGGTAFEGTANLSWYFGKDRSLSAGYRHEGGINYQTLEARQNVPFGEGTGWDVQGERSTQAGSQTYALDSSVQRNASHAVFRGDFRLIDGDTQNTSALHLSLSGALVHIGDTYALTRPVKDSFALVSVGKAQGVRIYINNQTVARTNSQGLAVVPDLTSFFDNQISIEDKDIPIDFLMPRVRLYVSPPLRSGSCLNFPLRRYQAFTGRLLQQQPEQQPLANVELILSTPDGPVDFWTGNDGEFYFDSQMATLDENNFKGCEALKNGLGRFLPAGTYPVTVKSKNETYQVQLTFPESSGETIDLGTLICRRIRPKASTRNKPAIPGTTSIQNSAPKVNTSSSAEPETSRLGSPVPPAKPGQAEPLSVESSAHASSAFKMNVPPAPAAEDADEKFPKQVVIHFPFNQAQLLPGELRQLEPVVKNLLAHPMWGIEIEGYTCSLGSEAYNLQLGLHRADAVRNYLLTAGVPKARILRVVSGGEGSPVCSEATEQCRRRNRRVVLLMVEVKSKLG